MKLKSAYKLFMASEEYKKANGLEQGLSSMLGPDAPTNDVAHVTIEEDVEIGDDGSITDTTSSPDATGYSTGD